MRQRALGRGLSLSEWGLVPAEGEGTVKEKAKGEKLEAKGQKVKAESEADLFKALGLHFIPPELREGIGEIEAAEAGELPRLVETAICRGAFTITRRASDAGIRSRK